VVSGDELRPLGEPLGPGEIHDSNAYTLRALAEQAGAAIAMVSRVGDRPAAVREALAAALDADLMVVSGGVSVGAHDHVKAGLAELGARQAFWGIALRPGRPTWCGTHPDGALVLGVPGNPVSAMVCFLLLARPAIAALLGAEPAADRATAILDQHYEKRPGRAHAIRCRLRLDADGWHATPTKEQGSHVLTSMLGADALALIPTASGTVEAGQRVEIELLPGKGS
jgi:molybdopterin molybdotransferase